MSYLKARNVMFVQQIKYFDSTELQAIIDSITSKLNPIRFAGIIHDKDIDENNEVIAPHLHLVMQFENARSLDSLAKIIIQEPERFEKWNGSVNNAYSYLIHKTNDASDLYQYDSKEVIANFDYVQLIDDISNKVTSRKKINDSQVINNILDLMYEGKITKVDAEKKLTGSQYAKAQSKIDAVHLKRLELNAKLWSDEKKITGESITIIWLYGLSGTGKTRLAKTYANQLTKNYFISGSSRDPFQKYNSESVVILDELRPTQFGYSDLLKMLDPFNEDAMAASRYFDKPLTADFFIITSPYCPKTFYDVLSIKNDFDVTVDQFNQLLRRISIVERITKDHIYLNTYSDINYEFKDVNEHVIKNPFTPNISNKQHSVIESTELFSQINRIEEERND